MPDFRLPHFYHLSLTILLGFYSFSQLRDPFSQPVDAMTYLVSIICVLPSMWAANHFFQEYQARREVSVKEAFFLLIGVQLLTELLGFFCVRGAV